MSQWKVFVSLILMSNTLAACSNNQFLKSMTVNVSTQNQQSFVNLSTELDLGNAVLDQVKIPVFDPRSQMQLGQISMGASSSGKQLITVSIDASSILHADPILGSTLPNGRALPGALGLKSGEVLAIPVLDHSRVYIGGDLKTSVVVGAAFSIPGLDGVMNAIPVASNIFFAQAFNSNLTGVAGIFGSQLPNQSGIAVFARFTPSVPLNIDVSPKGPLVMAQLRMQPSTAPVIRITSSGVTPKKKGNQVVENVDTQSQQDLLGYFYGSKKVLTPQ